MNIINSIAREAPAIALLRRELHAHPELRFEELRMLHNPGYDFNDALIPLGATYWERLAQAWLGALVPL